MKAGTAALKGAHSGMTIEKVEDVIDDLNEVSPFQVSFFRKRMT